MPGRDGMGPLGRGPMSGRGMGFCADGSRLTGWGMGPWRGRGLGRGTFWMRRDQEGMATSGLLDELRALREKVLLLEEKLAEKEARRRD